MKPEILGIAFTLLSVAATFSSAQEVYDSVETMCEWRLGREKPFSDKEGKLMEFPVEPITVDEVMACLKRVHKSINRWHRRGGKQGYLTFVSQFVR